MCINNNERIYKSVIKRPIRKSRTKRRRPKFLSLRSELISPKKPNSPMSRNPPSPPLTLFPLHPENLVEERDDDVALIFENDAVSSCCSLQSFLPSYQNDISSSEEEEEESRNLAEEQSFLVRTAMRSRVREAEEEKWVCYSEVVEKKEEVEEVTSTAVDQDWRKKINKKKKKKKMMIGKQLWLKLDYEGIMNAWSDKAPLFINGESPQTVPNLHHHPTLSSDSLPNRSLVMDGMGSEENNNNNNNNNNVWKVPEIMGQREASVLRYKEKRQNRLFSKRIRYEVRKLNAEKRPRMKGRFVKRS